VILHYNYCTCLRMLANRCITSIPLRVSYTFWRVTDVVLWGWISGRVSRNLCQECRWYSTPCARIILKQMMSRFWFYHYISLVRRQQGLNLTTPCLTVRTGSASLSPVSSKYNKKGAAFRLPPIFIIRYWTETTLRTVSEWPVGADRKYQAR